MASENRTGWHSGWGNNGPHGGLQLVNNANAFQNQLYKEAKHSLVHELQRGKSLGTIGRRTRASPDPIKYDTSANEYGNAWKSPASLTHRMRAASTLIQSKTVSRLHPKVRPVTSVKYPEKNKHGSPIIKYPWATPERDPVQRSRSAAADWRNKTRAPWLIAEGSTEKFQDMIGCPGGFGPRPAAPVTKKDQDRPSPFYVQDSLHTLKGPRHELCSSIAQLPAHLDPSSGSASRTVGTLDNALNSNLRERGGNQWAEYLQGNDPILQYKANSFLTAVPHRSIARLVKRMDSKPTADLNLHRHTISREKQPRKQRVSSSSGQLPSSWQSISRTSYNAPTKQDRIDSQNPPQIKIRRDDYTLVSEPRMRGPDAPCSPLPEYAKLKK